MPLHLIDNLKTTAGQMACHSIFYDWSLSGTTPDRLIVKPTDPWPGDAEKAKNLLKAAGVGERTGPIWLADWWAPENADELWTSHMHGFSWLRDLRTLGGPVAKEQGRIMIESWLNTFSQWHEDAWRPDVTARRIAMWVCHYDYFCGDVESSMDEKLLTAIAKQAKHISNSLDRVRGLAKFESIKGLLYAGISIESQEKWIEHALERTKTAITNQILPDGGHVTRSPATTLDVIEILVDMRTALKAAAYPVPKHIDETIEKMSAALRLFRHHDRKFSLFHGTQENSAEFIDSILASAGTQKKTKNTLEDTGFERLEIGKGLLIIDTGRAPEAPYDTEAHASPLAFEFSFGKNRIFTGCGSHPIDPKWQEALRFTSAHNTACIDHRNACEIKKNKTMGRKVTKTTTHREETKEAALLVASHNGYAPLNGIIHARKVYLSDEGNDLRGEDDFACAMGLVKPVEIAIRFHLHPEVTIAEQKEGEPLLLRVPGGSSWRFVHSEGVLKIEDSLYLGTGITPQKTKQIVIHGNMPGDHARLQWALKREG